MRIRCPACGAPYRPKPVLPPDVPRCPNCDAPAPADAEPARPRATPASDARSRAVTAVAGLHFLVATGGLCTLGGAAAVAGELGARPADLGALVLGGGVAFTWAAVGAGLLRRWVGAWYVSLAVAGGTLLFALATAPRNPCGAAYLCVLCGVIVPVLVVRRSEFR